MGGDDLGSDDEFLSVPIKGDPAGDEGAAEPDDDDNDSDDDDSMEGGPILSNSNNKRKREESNELTSSNYDQLNDDTTTTTTKHKKKNKESERIKALGDRIRQESIESKADMLSLYTAVKFLPQHIAKGHNSSNNIHGSSMDSNNTMDRLLCFTSKKQLKKTMKGSPRVIIVCISARRCVSVLKDLVPLKLRIAKLFPKQGTIDDQASQLENNDFGVAIGTPHRMKELMERGSLSFKNTILFGLDTYENEKKFTVYTLPDTSCHTQDLLRGHVHPYLSEKSTKGGKKGGDLLKVEFI
jgi:hypothetical protein